MALEERIYKDYLEALKNRKHHAKEFLGFLWAEIKNRKLALNVQTLEDGETISLLRKQQKKLEEALSMIAQSSNETEKEKLKIEIDLVQTYLPQLLSRAELSSLVDHAIRETQATSQKDMGKIMKILLAQQKERVDAKIASELIREKLT